MAPHFFLIRIDTDLKFISFDLIKCFMPVTEMAVPYMQTYHYFTRHLIRTKTLTNEILLFYFKK